jgi:hypothetical protein
LLRGNMYVLVHGGESRCVDQGRPAGRRAGPS